MLNQFDKGAILAAIVLMGIAYVGWSDYSKEQQAKYEEYSTKCIAKGGVVIAQYRMPLQCGKADNYINIE